MDLSLNTQRLSLRNIIPSEDDLTTYLSWLRDTKNNSFIQSARQDYSMQELVQFIKSMNADKNALLFGIFLAGFGEEFIGTLKVQPIDFSKGTAWLGIMIGKPEHRGLGYGREAMQEVLNYLFGALKLNAVFLGVDFKNINAVSLYKSLGFSEHSRENSGMVMVKKVSSDLE
jgi:RimJ/RimL family protein N-acetyltransferase